MSNNTPPPKRKRPLPKRCYIISLASLYPFYRAFNYFNVRDYDAGMLMGLSGIGMIIAAYAFYRADRRY